MSVMAWRGAGQRPEVLVATPLPGKPWLGLTVVLDKTGTLTRQAKLISVRADGFAPDMVLALAASRNAQASTPWPPPIVRGAEEKKLALSSPQDSTTSRRGVSGQIDGHAVLAGSEDFFVRRRR